MTKPIIGITTSYVKHNNNMEGVYIHQDYHQAIERGGGIPLLLPTISDPDAINCYVNLCDGFIFSGGEDLDPVFFGQDPHPKIGFFKTDRDEFELTLFHAVRKTGKPIFGVCRGLQLINVACGGTLIQDIETHCSHMMRHEQTVPRSLPFHTVSIRESKLHEIIGTNEIKVNSLHHQAIDELGDGLVITARSNDGIIEAIEGSDDPYLVAVQWHPESMSEKHETMQRLFDTLIKTACEKRERVVHKSE
ncbi:MULTISPECIES: gamma-glutamyl-gamma-aminobutyrate hydrolase family protein [Bacillaceae]|uniref:Gamma-glutamyl-gamma-aminobutyrate hydrolase n=1 Tax=Gottfriedia luciferensis TaxID=178774 RepID=A0ABX2ZWW6_9BACI|nr:MULTISPECIES: gamma-glutamyl-gamma-aminobutyrate hydrolase family protein [Bacillaceae]ODG93145.1 hypothetical protein BED47_16700 [Gottfriedia luciferensis]SFD09423.1 putative glutamine amidotransferase [Bacillus sp. UNCCL81]